MKFLPSKLSILFKAVVHKAIRAGLEHIDKPKQIKPYKCKAYSLGYPPGAELDRALSLARQALS